MKYKFRIVLLTAFLVMFTGCKQPTLVLNIEESPIITTAENISAKNISKAIVQAGIRRGWIMKPIKGTNEIIGTLNVRTHMAKVSIRYTDEFYSIKYLDSSNLRYDGQHIHKKYNSWVLNLDRDIRVKLSSL